MKIPSWARVCRSPAASRRQISRRKRPRGGGFDRVWSVQSRLDSRRACVCRGARLAGADHLREQRLVGADTDFTDIQDRAHRAARLRLRHAGYDYRRHRSDRDPRHDPARRRPCAQRRRPGLDRVPRAAPLGALQPRHRALSLEGRPPKRSRTRSHRLAVQEARVDQHELDN